MKKLLIGLALVSILSGNASLIAYAKGNMHLSPETEVQTSVVKEHEVQAAYYEWVKEMMAAKGNPQKVINLYAHDAILLPTLSPKMKLNEKQELDAYFKNLTSYDQLTITTNKLVTRVMGNVAFNTGFYTFSYVASDGKTVELPARFTFVYQLQDKKTWLIVTHQSSILPVK